MWIRLIRVSHLCILGKTFWLDMSSSKYSLFTYAGGKNMDGGEIILFPSYADIKWFFNVILSHFSCFQSHDYLQVWVNNCLSLPSGHGSVHPSPSALWMLRVCFLVQRSICLACHLLPHPTLCQSSIHIIGKCYKIKMRGCFQHGDRTIMPVCLNYFFVIWR